MAAASPIPALAAGFAALREEAVSLVEALRDDDTAAGRSLSTSLRQFLRDTAAPNDRLQTMAAAAATSRVVLPALRRPVEGAPEPHRGNGLPPGRPHP